MTLQLLNNQRIESERLLIPNRSVDSDLNGIGNVMEVQNLDKNKRNSIIREVCKQGAVFRQLARITGISYGIIQGVATDHSLLT